MRLLQAFIIPLVFIFCYAHSMGLLDFLFPKYCINCKKLGSYICANCFSYLSFETHGICLVCGKGAIDGITHSYCRGRKTIDGAYASTLYKGVVRKLLFRFKYKPYVSDLRIILGDLFYESLIQHEGFSQVLKSKPILVPIPLHVSKLQARGYNHAEILADELSRRFNLKTINMLERVKKTKTQFGLKREERKENVAGAFALRMDSDLTPTLSNKWRGSWPPNIILVDDILTTGATMQEAARVLKEHGVTKVWALAFARD